MSHLFGVSGGPGRSIAARCISAVALGVWISPVTVAALTQAPAPVPAATRAPGPAPTMEFSAETRVRQQLVQVALARAGADSILRGATVLNVVTGEWEKNQDIVIKGERIAWVGKSGGWAGKASQ
jgi:hypothetical protein